MCMVQKIKNKKQKRYSRYNLYLCEIYDGSGVYLKTTLLYYTRTIKESYILLDPITDEKYIFNHIGNYYYNQDNENYIHDFVRKFAKTDADPNQVYFTLAEIKKLNEELCVNVNKEE